MRLDCPNCAAQYDIPETAIPPQGRNLQCAACNHGWYHTMAPVKQPVKMPPPLIAQPEPAIQPSAPMRPALTPAIAEILRSEAAQNSAASQNAPPAAVPEPAMQKPRRTSGAAGFWRGFISVSIVLASLATAYLTADQISAKLPQLGPSLLAYTSLIDQIRLGLLHQTGEIAARFTS